MQDPDSLVNGVVEVVAFKGLVSVAQRPGGSVALDVEMAEEAIGETYCEKPTGCGVAGCETDACRNGFVVFHNVEFQDSHYYTRKTGIAFRE